MHHSLVYKKKFQHRLGFTLIELIVCVTIIGVLVALFWINAPKFISQARDAKRKTDISALKSAFEDYFNDKQSYPPASLFAAGNCGKAAFAPYLPVFPCDPKTRLPYSYVTTGKTYALYATLENSGTASSSTCSSTGCGLNNQGNIGVGSPPSYGSSVLRLGLFNNDTQRCVVGGCGGGYWCDTGFRCGPDAIYCVQDSTCP